MIAQYLKTKYAPGGRGPDVFDCWGLARHVHHHVYGRPLLPSFCEAHPEDIRRRQGAIHALHDTMPTRDVPMREGALVEAWIGSLFVHIGIVVKVDGRLMILETDTPSGPVLTKPTTFASRYSKIRYFDTQ